MEALLYAFLTISIATIFFVVFLIIRTEVAFKNQMKILSAIDAFACEGNFEEGLRLIGNIEEMDVTIWRLWDFGYKNILPKEDYELIKSYIH